MFPISRCHCVPMFPLHGAIVCLCHPSRVPLFAPKVAHHMGCPLMCQGRLSHDAHVYKVAYVMVPACAKVSHLKVPSCAMVAQVNVPLCPYVAHRMVPSVPMLPTAWCVRVPMLPSLLLHDSPHVPMLPITCGHRVHITYNHISHRLCPSCAMLPMSVCLESAHHVPRSMCPECAHRVPKFS